jgi:hypothetical protein
MVNGLLRTLKEMVGICVTATVNDDRVCVCVQSQNTKMVSKSMFSAFACRLSDAVCICVDGR